VGDKSEIEWLESQLSRTIFKGIRFIIPKRVLSPFAFLGMLTFFCFVILAVTGLYLMLYYEPTLKGAYDSVYKITNEVPYGFVIRSLHYHASNAMVLLAVMHCFYLFFKGRYKIRNTLLWLDGLILGLLTVLEAFTGYSCIMNERAMFAMSIAQTLASDINPSIALIVTGGGTISDFILRFYSFHVIIIPAVMILLIIFHFPRNLILDIPFFAVIVGVILIIAGLFPAELGNKYFPGLSFAITVPEWYFAGIYAFLRTGIDRDLAALILPIIFVGILAIIPFIDRGKTFRVRERPFISAFGVSSICQILLATIWGSRSYDFINPVASDADIPIDPLVFWPAFIATGIVSFGVTYFLLKRKGAVRKRVKREAVKFYLLEREVILLAATIVIIQIVLNYFAFQAYSLGFWETALIEWGVSFLGLSIALYGYRISRPQEIPLPRGRKEAIVIPLGKATGILVAFQAAIVAYAWLLDPFFYKSQKVFGIILGVALIIFAVIVYLYRITNRMSGKDYEWIAVGLAVVAQLILFAFFI